MKKYYPHTLAYSLIIFQIIALTGCGGGGGSTPGTPTPPTTTPTGSFSLALSLNPLTTAPNVSRPIQVQVNSQGGFAGNVNITASGLPAGVTVSPSPLVVSATHSGNLTVTVASGTATGSPQITLVGTSGSLQATAPLTLQINPQAVPANRPFKLVGGALERGFYDETRKLLFVTNFLLNEVDVLSGSDLSIQSRLSIPAPIGIDQMADGNTIVVGTATSSLYTINESTFAITRHSAPNFSSVSSTTLMVVPVAMANGKVLTIGNEEGIFINYIFGGSHLIEWDSVTDTFTELPLSAAFPSPSQEIDNVKRSADHKWATLGADKLYLYSSDTNSFSSTTLPADLRDVAANADGTQFAVSLAQQLNFYDRNFTPLGTTALPAGVFTHTGLRYSGDGTRVYWPTAGTGGTSNITSVIDTTTFANLGHIGTVIGAAQDEPVLMAVDSSQRAFYSGASGVETTVFDALSNGPTQSDANFGFTLVRAPLNVSLPVSFTSINVPPGISITVGGAPVIIQSFDPIVTAIIPPSAVPGPADILFTFPDGEAFLKPISFSYGLTIETPTATLLPTTGNPTVGLTGFGFNDPLSQLPSITIGGHAATNITSIEPSGVLEELVLTVPSGPAGPADLTVTGTKGTATRTAAFTYVATSIVPATGLIQLLYDPHRNLVYALTSTQVDVFNPATSQFGTPLVPDSTPGVNYIEMALTPDGSKLLLADATNSTLTVFNPDNPASHTVTVLTQSPQSIATTSTGKAFLSCGLGLIEFDLATLTSTFQEGIPFLGAMKLAASPDGTHMVGALGNSTLGTVVIWNSATDTFISQGFIDGFFNDIAIANDGSQFAPISGGGFDPGILGVFFDSQLHLINATTYPDLAPPDAVQAEGAIFSPAGSVLLQPMLNAIEFFDTSTGQLRARMMMPEPLVNKTIPFASTGVAVDPSGQTVFVISASGLTLIHLPTPVDQLGGVAWPLSTSHPFSQAKLTGTLNRQKQVFRTKK